MILFILGFISGVIIVAYLYEKELSHHVKTESELRRALSEQIDQTLIAQKQKNFRPIVDQRLKH